MVHVASSQTLHGVEAEDGRVNTWLPQTLLPQLCHFHYIRPQGHFSLLTGPINRP
jgi:hypothetical protein